MAKVACCEGTQGEHKMRQEKLQTHKHGVVEVFGFQYGFNIWILHFPQILRCTPKMKFAIQANLMQKASNVGRRASFRLQF